MAEKLEPAHASVILFDGLCVLCSRSVRFILERSEKLYFAPLQSQKGQNLARKMGYDGSNLTTILFLHQNHCYTESRAILEIARHLSGGWPLTYVFVLIPWPLRDLAYRIVARNRYGWFGKNRYCFMPSARQKERFLDWI